MTPDQYAALRGLNPKVLRARLRRAFGRAPAAGWHLGEAEFDALRGVPPPAPEPANEAVVPAGPDHAD
jgi:hypothetical protein